MISFCKEILSKHVPKSTFVNFEHVGGGCINEAAKLITSNKSYFLKWNSKNLESSFLTEQEGLKTLSNKSNFSIPKVYGAGTSSGYSYLVLDWVDTDLKTNTFWASFGERLADMHRSTNNSFGLAYDNFIGSLPQKNKMYAKWSDFFIDCRLIPLVKLAAEKSLLKKSQRQLFDSLYKKLPALIPEEQPALLHGDLWSGNFLCSSNSTPVLIDPAVYFGHRETEIAFTKLFGGFDQTFYESYRNSSPLEPGFEDRIDVHNLYPLLVHLNLFGSSYLSGITNILKRFA